MDNPISAAFSEAQARLVIQTADLPLGTLSDMVEARAIDLEPGFQRRERWSTDKQSALIESFLLNVPVPPIYLAEEASGTYTAIDGKQRLRAITEFLHGRLALRPLERLTAASGKKIGDMPTDVTNALRLRPFLRVVTLLKQTDPLLKYEVFIRLNRGGETLKDQEIRNVAFRGKLNDLVYELSQEPFLWKQLKVSDKKASAYRDMDDAEYVLRFLTLRYRMDKFSGSLAREMDSFMRARSSVSDAELATLRSEFVGALGRCEALWGGNAFRRPEGGGWRDQTLAGMYDAQMLATAGISEANFTKALGDRGKIVESTRTLFKDPEFDKAVRTGTNTPARITYRVKKMKAVLESV